MAIWKKALVGLSVTCLLMASARLARAAAADVVLYASDATNIHGNWSRGADPSAAGNQVMTSVDRGWSSPDSPLAAPSDFFDVTFAANAGVPYHVWLRLRAAGDSKYNDSVFVQFSDAVNSSGAALYRIGTAAGIDVNLQSCNGCALSGWGWMDGAYWLSQSSTLRFSTSGVHTMRVQTREDGVQIDQIVLSPSKYLTAPPGPKLADTTIVPKPASAQPTPYRGTAAAVPGTIQAEDFDNGGEGVAYHDTTSGNAGGAYRSTDVDLETASEGGYDVGWISAGEWLTYSVNVATAGNYLLEARVASLGGGGTFHVESAGVNLTGALTIPDTGGWQSWKTISKPVALAAGLQGLKVVFDTAGANAVGNLSWIRLSQSTSTPYKGTAIAIPGAFSTADFDLGGEGLAYHDTTAGNSGGAYRATDVDIEVSSLGSNDIGWVDTGEWLAYSVNVAAAGNYVITLQAASPHGTGAVHARFGATDTASATVPNTGGWQNWTNITLNASLAAGAQKMMLMVDGGGFNMAGVAIVAAAPVLGAPPTLPAPAPPTLPAPAPPVSTTTITVNAGDDLQAAIDRSLPGDTIVLQAGATFTGNFILPAKSGSQFVTIRTSAADAALPGATTRIDPSYAPLLPKLKSPNSLPALATDPGAHHYRLLGLEFQASPLGYYDMLDLGDGSSLQNTLAMVPHDLVVDRVYMHGDPVVGEKRAIGLNSASTAIVNCYISEIKAEGQDSQAIAGWNGPGPYTITNNYLEAAAENILFGGSDPAVPNLVPSNITISGNYITKQLAWRGSKWEIKNALELKSAAHVVISGNTLENSWVNAQMGALVLFTVRDQDGTAPWSTVSDVTFANNVVRHGASFLSVLGYDDDPTARPSIRMVGLSVTGNLVYDIDPQKWGDPTTGEWGLGRLIQILGGPQTVNISHNTVLGSTPNASPTINSAVTIGQIGDTYLTQGLTMRDNVMSEGEYGVIGDTVGVGPVALDTYTPGWAFVDNLMVRGTSGGSYPYPATTTVSPTGVAVVDPTSFAVMPGFATLPTSDGITVGANITGLRSAIPGLDLSK